MQINNPVLRPRREQKCLSYREPIRIVCYIICALMGICIIFVNVTKIYKTCWAQTPYILCIANRHCAIMKKDADNSHVDVMPFWKTSSQCVARTDQPESFYKAVESSVDWVNSFATSDNDQDIIIPATKSNKIVTDFKYEFDVQVGLGLTRYEIGLWIIFLAFFFLRKYLIHCGNRKTSFDFMRPAQSQILKKDKAFIKGSDNKLHEINQADLRKLRQNMLGNNNKKTAVA